MEYFEFQQSVRLYISMQNNARHIYLENEYWNFQEL